MGINPNFVDYVTEGIFIDTLPASPGWTHHEFTIDSEHIEPDSENIITFVNTNNYPINESFSDWEIMNVTLKKFSLLIFQAPENEGKSPYLLYGPKREE